MSRLNACHTLGVHYGKAFSASQPHGADRATAHTAPRLIATLFRRGAQPHVRLFHGERKNPHHLSRGDRDTRLLDFENEGSGLRMVHHPTREEDRAGLDVANEEQERSVDGHSEQRVSSTRWPLHSLRRFLAVVREALAREDLVAAAPDTSNGSLPLTIATGDDSAGRRTD